MEARVRDTHMAICHCTNEDWSLILDGPPQTGYDLWFTLRRHLMFCRSCRGEHQNTLRESLGFRLLSPEMIMNMGQLRETELISRQSGGGNHVQTAGLEFFLFWNQHKNYFVACLPELYLYIPRVQSWKKSVCDLAFTIRILGRHADDYKFIYELRDNKPTLQTEDWRTWSEACADEIITSAHGLDQIFSF